MANIKYDENGKWTNSTTFTTPTGWMIVTKLSKTKDSNQIVKSQDFTKLSELPEEIQKGLQNGELTLVLK